MSKATARVKPAHFFRDHPIFTFDELVASEPDRPVGTVKALLRYHTKCGNLIRVRRGLFAAADWVDPWLVASRIAPDGILAYDGALPLQQPWREAKLLPDLKGHVSFLTAAQRLQRIELGDFSLSPVRPPRALGKRWATAGVMKTERHGMKLEITTPERTVVDLLDRVALASPEELWESFVFGGLDFDEMVRHARALASKIVAARLGFYLEHVPGVSKAQLNALEKERPSSPAYFDRVRQKGKSSYVNRWNLVAPLRLHQLLRRTDFRGRAPMLPKESELPL